jgi:acetoin utilization deacetylase AcuC-like enzyme
MRVWTNPLHEKHTVPAGFPEVPERMHWAEAACREAGLPPVSPTPEELAAIACTELIQSVHTDRRLERLQEAAVPYRAKIDTPDCPVSPGTPEAAVAAVKVTLLALVEAVRRKDTSLALTRPPGHHATSRLAMGFCYLNNIALAAKQAQNLGRARVAILDFDVHHGNGTQEIFYKNGDVFFCSQHEDPRTQYPGTGFVHERGAEAGLGTTLNLTYPARTGGVPYLRDFEDQVLPALSAHKADVLLISAGFDAHAADPLGGLELTGTDFRWLGNRLAQFVREEGIPALIALEGGYDPLCFSDGLRPFLEGWLG